MSKYKFKIGDPIYIKGSIIDREEYVSNETDEISKGYLVKTLQPNGEEYFFNIDEKCLNINVLEYIKSKKNE